MDVVDDLFAEGQVQARQAHVYRNWQALIALPAGATFGSTLRPRLPGRQEGR